MMSRSVTWIVSLAVLVAASAAGMAFAGEAPHGSGQSVEGETAPGPLPPSPPQFRAYWVDAFGPGLYTVAEIDKLVADTKAANLNAIVAQVGRRGDCFCNRASMPRTQQAGVTPAPFDPLQTLIDKAHAQGIEVHAWIITTAMWNSATPPANSDHAFNQHGPTALGYDNWLSVRYDGATREYPVGGAPSAGSNWFFDPGHPAAADYIVRMYTSVAENYDIDGLNFDRVRYPDFQMPDAPNDGAWGYNPVALERFHAATGRTDLPHPTDAQWQQWRRDQITGIVRKVYLETYAIKPELRISADTITYEYGPQNPKWGSWERARPYREVLQDWRAWMEEGILDLNMPMNYKREHCTAGTSGCFGDQELMYEEWNEFAKDHQYRRRVAIGSALYLNYVHNSLTQVREALAPSAAGNAAVGWVGYSYRVPDCLAPGTPVCLPGDVKRSADQSRAELTRALTQPSEYDPVTPPVFAEPAAVPTMPWKASPTTGHMRGTVRTAEGAPFDQVRVDVYDAESDALVASRLTDGSGWFGVVDLAPGRYKAIVDAQRAGGQRVARGRRVAVTTISAGALSTVTITAEMR